jgi:hypothetical protein
MVTERKQISKFDAKQTRLRRVKSNMEPKVNEVQLS